MAKKTAPKSKKTPKTQKVISKTTKVTPSKTQTSYLPLLLTLLLVCFLLLVVILKKAVTVDMPVLRNTPTYMMKNKAAPNAKQPNIYLRQTQPTR